ncbi:AraC family transcriptional regulator [Roseobacter weihaiensis]|uniref:AraC family transcriptional regulator n=1 Tax=Roseobacter weihaiensis TaxID=2763262 RepID=UPI001D09CC45|nr:AraC family transcriptional regulator [Roseobacter sp. H9]
MTLLQDRAYFSQHPVLQTDDLDEARFQVSKKLCDHRLDMTRRGARLCVTHNAVRGRHLSVNYLRYGTDVMVDPGHLSSFYLFQIPLSGDAEIVHRGDKMTAHKRAGTLLNPDRAAVLHWGTDCSKLLFQIDRAHLETVAETLTGMPNPGPIRFDLKVDFTTRHGRELQRMFAICAAGIERGALFQTPLSASDLRIEYDLIVALLTLQKSNISHIIRNADSMTRPPDIRRALEFIHANLGNAITVPDIANAVGINVRTLQKGFQRAFGKTPQQVLRNARLDTAHYQLLARRDTPSVSDTALACGFSHLGRFSAYYRARFGRLPSMRR